MSSRTRWINRFAKRSALALAAASASAGLVNSAFAQSNGTYTFNGTGAWSNSDRWLDNIIPDGVGSVVGFGSTAAGVGISLDTLNVTLDSNRTSGVMSFADSDTLTPAGWILSGGSTLRLQQDVGGTPTINVGALGNNTNALGHLGQRIAQITAIISGNQGLSKRGAGTLLLGGNNSAFTGNITMDEGPLMLGHANAAGTAANIIIRTGNLALRNDTGTNFGSANITLRNETVIGVGNGIVTSNGKYSTGVNGTHTIGDITVTGLGHRGIVISGSNGYGLSMGSLSVLEGLTLRNQGDDNAILNYVEGEDVDRHSNNVNGLGSGLVTIDRVRHSGTAAALLDLTGTGSLAGSITITNGISQPGGGALSLMYSGDKTLTINGTDTHTGTTSVTGNGTVIYGSAAINNGNTLTITGGSVILSGASLANSVSTLNFGGGTVSAGNDVAYLHLGSGGSISTTGKITVNTGFLTDGTSASTVATIVGKLNLGATNKIIDVKGAGDSLTLNGIASGAGAITKQGKGTLNLLSANDFTGTTLTITDGALIGTAQSSGTPFGTASVDVTAGGSIGLLGIAGANTTGINSYTASDSGSHGGISVDATAGGATTLSIGSWLGRVGGEHATVKVTGGTDSLGTNEHVFFGTAPTPLNGMLDGYWSVQNSTSDKTLSFADISAGEIIKAAYNGSTDINTAGDTAIYRAASGSTNALSGAATVFAVGVDAGQEVTGSSTLTVGTGNFGGVILNGGAGINSSTLTAGAGELVVHSGGSSANSIAAVISLGGALTTAGPTDLNVTGNVNMGGATRDITVTGSTVTLSGVLSNGGFVKRGGSTLVISGTNTGYAGPVTVQNGILQIGASPFGDLGTSAITNNATVTFRRSDSATFSNAISGSGNLVQDAGTSSGFTSLTGALTYTGDTFVQSGTLRPGAATGRLPNGTNLSIAGAGTYDLNGLPQTIATLNGTGTIIQNSASNAGAASTLTVGSGSFGGSIRNGSGGSIALTKTGGGELILSGNNSNFTGTLSVTGGSLRIDNEAASSTGIINLQDSTLKLNMGPDSILDNTINIATAATGTFMLTGRTGEAAASNQQISQGVRFVTGASSSTLVLDLRGRQMQFAENDGANGSNATLNNFSGTMKFLDSNPVGSRVRIGTQNATAGSTAGSNFATFAFGTGNLEMSMGGGSAVFNMGAVSGGTNTIMKGTQNVSFRDTTYMIGALAGNHTFAGSIQNWTTAGGLGAVQLQKVGATSTLNLLGSSSYTKVTTVAAGTLALATGANISGSPTISVGTNATLAFNGGTFSTPQAFINLTAANSALNVTNAPGGFSSRQGLTYLGSGSIYGNVNHNTGIATPGVIGTAGTITFANNVTLGGIGNLTFDLTPGVTGVLGGAATDMMRVPTTNGLTINGGVIRLSFVGGGSAGLAPGQFYPLLTFAGTIQGTGITAVQAFATFHGSFDVQQGSGTYANVVGVQVNNLGSSTADLTWAPTTSDNTWDASTAAIKNYTPTGGSGSLFFFNGDTLTFDDTASAANHTVVLGPIPLAPARMTVTTSSNYVFTGAGSIVAGSLTKNGSGTLTFSNLNGNSFAGGITVNGGVLAADRDPPAGNQWSPWGSATLSTITLNNDAGLAFQARIPNNTQNPTYAALVVNGNNKVYWPNNQGTQNWTVGNVFGAGTLALIRPVGDNSPNLTMTANMISFTGTLKFPDNSLGGNQRWNDGAANNMTGGPSITFDLGTGTNNITFRNVGSFQMGALMGGPLNPSVNLNGASTVTFGQKNINTTFGGRLTGGVTGAYVKAGSLSTMTLTGSYVYTAQTFVNEGTLALSNAGPTVLASSTITVGTNGTLDVSLLNGGSGGMSLNNNQVFRSNGLVAGGAVTVIGGSTAGGSNYGANSQLASLGASATSLATLAPGNSVGTLSVGSLTIGSFTRFQIEIDSTGMDNFIVTTDDGFDLNDVASIEMINLGGVVPGTYSFIDYIVDLDDVTGFDPAAFSFADFAYTVSMQRNDTLDRLEIVIVDNSGKWFKDTGSDVWGTTGYWTSDYIVAGSPTPNNVEFGTFITAAQSVSLQPTGQFVNNITFNSPFSYTIHGTSTLTLDSGGTSGVNVQVGQHSINSAVRLLHNAQITTAAGTGITFGGTITNANNAVLTKTGAGNAVFKQLNMNTGSFTITGGTVVMSAKPAAHLADGTSIVRNLSISAGATLNLTNNSFVIDTAANPTATQLTDVRAELSDGRLFSSSSTGGLHPTRLGYRTNVAIASPTALGMGALGTFGGIAVDASSILIRLTLEGDTNLDGDVDIEDMYNLAFNWLGTNLNWYQGDFNYDGIVNATDLSLLAANWQFNFVGGEVLDGGGALGIEQALAMMGGLGGISVPEPSTLGLAGVAAVGLLGRRRRRRV